MTEAPAFHLPDPADYDVSGAWEWIVSQYPDYNLDPDWWNDQDILHHIIDRHPEGLEAFHRERNRPMLTIQPANTVTGDYDVNRPRPYPYHIGKDGLVGRQDFWQGDPFRLLGFQSSVDEQRVALHNDDFQKVPQMAVGMFPVFLRKDGSIYNLTYPITTVTETRDDGSIDNLEYPISSTTETPDA